jgi:hypothetical protein
MLSINEALASLRRLFLGKEDHLARALREPLPEDRS